ncbi:hypothetical protein PspLS_11318 [Pyricularia sp. CBS 133598]|nr:hypothetical protein PspLS_11318 [Pyricularia sp. CBS 133598]
MDQKGTSSGYLMGLYETLWASISTAMLPTLVILFLPSDVGLTASPVTKQVASSSSANRACLSGLPLAHVVLFAAVLPIPLPSPPLLAKLSSFRQDRGGLGSPSVMRSCLMPLGELLDLEPEGATILSRVRKRSKSQSYS